MEIQTQERPVNNSAIMLPDTYGRENENAPVIQSPMDMPVKVFTEALHRREQNRNALLRWIKGNLVKGTDYGSIHMVGKGKCQYAYQGRRNECPIKSHWSKDTLFKSGAEKITGMMALTARFPNIPLYERSAVSGEDIKVIIIRCELHTPQGFVVGEGTGARRTEQDYGDINKSIKMASKSALIDAVLRVAGLSQIFTQDLEDMYPEKEPDSRPQNINGQQQKEQAKPDKPVSVSNADNNLNIRVTQETYSLMMKTAKDKGLTFDDVRKMCLERFNVMPQHIRETEARSLTEELKNT